MSKVLHVLFFVLIIVTLTDAEFYRQKDGADFLGKSLPRSKSKGVRARTQVFEEFFNVYDPTFVAIVWPKLKNGIHLSLSPMCWDDVSVFYKQLLEGKPWAYNVLDASGHYQSGIFEGNNFWIGSKQECLQLDKSFITHYINGSRNSEIIVFQKENSEDDWLNFSQFDEKTHQTIKETTPPFSLSFNIVSLELNITKPSMVKGFKITLGLCLPRTCSPEDIHAILDFAIMITDHLRTNKTIPRSVQISSVRKINDAYDLRNDSTALVLIFFTISLLMVIMVATIVDLDLIRINPNQFRTMSFDIQKLDANTQIKEKHMKQKDNNHVEVHKKRPYEVPRAIMPKSEIDIDLEKLTINNNKNNSNNINFVKVKKKFKPNANHPSITLDVIAVDERKLESCCNRCGKYKKQCYENRNPHKVEKLQACPRIKFNNSYASFNTEIKDSQCKKKDFFKRVLCCFSLRYSWRRICNKNLTNRDLSIVHGFKIISTFWIIFVHVTLIVFYLSENGDNHHKQNTAFNILATGTLAFDTLVFVSGILSSHHFFYLRSRYTSKELVSFGGNVGHVLQFICFVSNRAVRLLPPYAYTIFLGAVLSRASIWTFPLELPDRDHTNCDNYWWKNILYINNFYKEEERCMQISWYLSLETQLHALGTLLLSFVPGRGGTGAAAVGVAMASVAADFITSWRDQPLVMKNSYAAYALLIERPWARVAPYFVGVLTGWLIHKLEGKISVSRMVFGTIIVCTIMSVADETDQINTLNSETQIRNLRLKLQNFSILLKYRKFKSFFLWTFSLIMIPVILIRPWFTSHLGVMDMVLSVLAHGFWTAALAWPTIVLVTSYTHFSRLLLDNSFVAALSRLSYGMLVLHGVLAKYLLLSTETALSMDSASLWSYYTGIMTVSLLGALLLSLLLETPCCSLLRRLSDCANANT